jgi:hypothetical protein
MNIYNTPYTYLIGWSNQNKYYYGVRYAKDCHPNDFWDNRHLENVLLHTPDNLINKIGRIQGRFPDGSYMILLIGQADIATNNYRLSLRGDQTRCFAESFKRIYPGLMKEQDITGTTHAFGAFMQCVESLNE